MPAAESGREKLVPLVGDSCLFTAAIFCALVWGPLPLALALGPVGAWYLHGVPLDRRALLGGAAGLAAGLAAAVALLVLAPLVVRTFAPAGTPQELAGAALMLAAFAGAFAAVVLAADVGAMRDLSPARRLHPRLDIARLAATAVAVVFAAVVTAVQHSWPGSGIGDAGVFALAAAFVGALTMFVAEPVRRRLRPPPSSAEDQAPDEDAGVSTESAQR